MLGPSFAIRSRNIGNDLAFQLARAVSAKFDMVRAQNRTTELEKLLANFSEREQKVVEDLKENYNVVARLETKVAELKKREALAKKKAIKDFKSSDDFQEAI